MASERRIGARDGYDVLRADGGGAGDGTMGRLSRRCLLRLTAMAPLAWPLARRGVRAQASGYTVSTLAGSGEIGFADGPGAQARFFNPMALAIAADGSLYVADHSTSRIRRIAADGEVTTIAGTGMVGYRDGPAAEAEFNAPWDVALAPTGEIYVAELGTNRIRRITVDGQVETFAGSGTPDITGQGYADGPAAQARFAAPQGIALDRDGNVLVVDTFNHRIRVISPDGFVRTLAGGTPTSPQMEPKDGTGEAARFYFPDGIAVAEDGSIYIADSGNNLIRKLTPAGEVRTVAGTGEEGYRDGPAAQARFAMPTGIAVDTFGNLFVCELLTHRIRHISADGLVTTIAGSGGLDEDGGGFADGPALSARFDRPNGLAVAASGAIYVADTGNQRIRRLAPSGN